MGDLSKLTIAAAREGLRKGEFTAVELAESCLREIEGAGALNAFVHNTPEIALDQAKAADARLKAEGSDAPAMCGIPLGIKDLFCTRHVPSQAASFILDGFTLGDRGIRKLARSGRADGEERARRGDHAGRHGRP